MKRALGMSMLIGACLLFCAPLASAMTGPTLGSVDWHSIGEVVRFRLHWTNPDPGALTVPVDGSMKSQEFGVFLPDFGPIGQFHVPPIAPNSFFDVFFDVPLAALPPEPLEQGPGNGPSPLGTAAVQRVPCVPDTIWDGNVDIVWTGPGVSGQVLRHYGDLIVCPGGGPSYIHVKSTTCAVAAPWSVSGLCPGFSATLVNEDLSPAPNPIPPGWTGFISMTAAPGMPVGTTCCPILHFDCAGSPAEIELCATACDCSPNGPTLGSVDWQTIGEMVRFHLRWTNPDPAAPTVPVSGSMKSQEFGVFLPDFGPIGQFNLPPIMPNSFFDVFFDVPLANLPPEPLEQQSGNGPALRTAATQGVPCVPDTIWDGNVDIVWTGPGVSGQVLRHYGDLIVCPGGGPSYIHVRSTTCAVAAPWSVSGLCPGFSATLVNEDLSPAPNPIPPGWTGFISMTAATGVPVGSTCCPILHFDCAGSPAEIELCATACDCNTVSVPSGMDDFNFGIRSTVPNPTRGSITVGFAISRESAARLAVYDASGKLVCTIVDGTLSAGPHTVTWDGHTQSGRKLPSGAYFLKLSAEGRSTSRKVIVVH